MSNPIDITGQRFERLLVLGKAEPYADRRTRWRVRCDCGVEKTVDGAHMRYGKIRSCGCLAVELAPDHARRHLASYAGQNARHGMSKTPVYAVWKTMRGRCRNPRNSDYRFYGALGVKVCERWDLFENFLADMGERPKDMTLDRIDPAGDYSPENCRWASWEVQRENKRPRGFGRSAEPQSSTRGAPVARRTDLRTAVDPKGAGTQAQPPAPTRKSRRA